MVNCDTCNFKVVLTWQNRPACLINYLAQVILTGVRAEAVKAVVDLVYSGCCSLEQVMALNIVEMYLTLSYSMIR